MQRAIYQFGTISNFLNPQTSLIHVEEYVVFPITVAGREAEAELIRYHPHPLSGFVVLRIKKVMHSV